MKRYTLSVYDNTVKEPVMTVQLDEFASGHDKDGAWLRAGKGASEPRASFMNTTFNVEQKFDKDFNPGRVLAAIREDAARLTERAARPEASGEVADWLKAIPYDSIRGIAALVVERENDSPRPEFHNAKKVLAWLDSFPKP